MNRKLTAKEMDRLSLKYASNPCDGPKGLFHAAIHWFYIALVEKNNGHMNRFQTYWNCGKALMVEHRTGKAVCACHLIPYDECRKLRK